jgi:hypothetical protein
MGGATLVALGCALAGCGKGGDDDGADASAVEGKLVFVTSTTHTGDFGSLEDADTLCAERAAAGGRSGTFRAWLSTTGAPASGRLTHADGPYVRTDGVGVADDWAGLVSGSLLAAIDRDEMGTARTGDVWTGTLPDGSSFTVGDCDGWTAAALPAVSLCGRSTSSGPQWTNNQQVACGASLRLYCIEQ